MLIEGGCYCGALRFKAEGEPLFAAQCLCRECQQVSGGGGSFVMAMPEAGFSYTKGAAKTFRRGDLPRPAARDFCPECGTHVLNRSPARPDAVLIRAGALDDPSQYPGPQMVTYTSEMRPYHAIPEGVPSFPRFPER